MTICSFTGAKSNKLTFSMVSLRLPSRKRILRHVRGDRDVVVVLFPLPGQPIATVTMLGQISLLP